MSLIAYVNPHTREEDNPNKRREMMESTLSQEQARKLLLQLVNRSGKQGVDDEELRTALAALEELAISAAMYKMWNEGEIEFGWEDGDFVVFPANP